MLSPHSGDVFLMSSPHQDIPHAGTSQLFPAEPWPAQSSAWRIVRSQLTRVDEMGDTEASHVSSIVTATSETRIGTLKIQPSDHT